MDKLSESKKAEVKKMSDTRLISKLTQAGYSSKHNYRNYEQGNFNEHVGRSNCGRQENGKTKIESIIG